MQSMFDMASLMQKSQMTPAAGIGLVPGMGGMGGRGGNAYGTGAIGSMGTMWGMGGMGGMGGFGGKGASGGGRRERSRSRERGGAGIFSEGKFPGQTAESLGLDEKAQEALAELSEYQQQKIVEDINPQAVRNPSAVAIKKINEMKKAGGMGITRESEMAANNLGLDERAKEALGTLSNIQQQLVLKSINPSECINPSAVAIKKLTEIKQRNAMSMMGGGMMGMAGMMGMGMMGMGGLGLSPEVAMAAEALGLDENAKQALGKLPALQQQLVIQDVNPEACRNPSAVVIKKVTEIKHTGKGGKGGMVGMLKMATTGDHFRTMLDDRAKNALNELAYEDQMKVLGMVDPQTCVNPSAVVFSNIRKLKAGTMVAV